MVYDMETETHTDTVAAAIASGLPTHNTAGAPLVACRQCGTAIYDAHTTGTCTDHTWYVVVTRETHDGVPLPAIAVAAGTEADAEAGCEADGGLIECLVTVDAKNEGYVVTDVYPAAMVADSARIILPAGAAL